jgi:predicted ArsR family transcriptional regulator
MNSSVKNLNLNPKARAIVRAMIKRHPYEKATSHWHIAEEINIPWKEATFRLQNLQSKGLVERVEKGQGGLTPRASFWRLNQQGLNARVEER